jgi:hypothetical protein
MQNGKMMVQITPTEYSYFIYKKFISPWSRTVYCKEIFKTVVARMFH